MKELKFWLPDSQGKEMHVYRWDPDDLSQMIGVIMLVHGSVEHAGRYQHFAKVLTDNNFVVYAPDYRGHGETAKRYGDFSYFGKQGWAGILADLELLEKHIRNEFPNASLSLFGHSMGSFVVREYVSLQHHPYNAVMISGSSFGKPLFVNVGLLMIRVVGWFSKRDSQNRFFHKAIYDKFNKKIKNPKTSADFTTTDPEMAQKYLDDPFNGRIVTLGYAEELAKATLRTAQESLIKKTPDIPFLIISGREDPVGGKKGKDVKKLYRKFKKCGKKLVEFELIPYARHELVNEKERDIIMTKMADWFVAKK